MTVDFKKKIKKIMEKKLTVANKKKDGIVEKKTNEKKSPTKKLKVEK